MKFENMFQYIENITKKPKPFSCYTAEEMWNDPYISSKMLELHLGEGEAAASRPKAQIEKSINWIIEHFNITNNTRLIDFGCGPGLYTNALAKVGAKVTGIDFSERSINHAKHEAELNNLTVEYVTDSYLDFTPDGKYDLITMIYCDFCALSDSQRAKLLRLFHEISADGGRILLDIYSMNHFSGKDEAFTISKSSHENIWTDFWSPDPYYALSKTFKYHEDNLLLDKHVILEENRTREIYNWLKCFDLASIKSELHNAGFEVESYFSNVCGDAYDETSHEIALVAKKS